MQLGTLQHSSNTREKQNIQAVVCANKTFANHSQRLIFFLTLCNLIHSKSFFPGRIQNLASNPRRPNTSLKRKIMPNITRRFIRIRLSNLWKQLNNASQSYQTQMKTWTQLPVRMSRPVRTVIICDRKRAAAVAPGTLDVSESGDCLKLGEHMGSFRNVVEVVTTGPILIKIKLTSGWFYNFDGGRRTDQITSVDKTSQNFVQHMLYQGTSMLINMLHNINSVESLNILGDFLQYQNERWLLWQTCVTEYFSNRYSLPGGQKKFAQADIRERSSII